MALAGACYGRMLDLGESERNTDTNTKTNTKLGLLGYKKVEGQVS